MLHIFNRQEQLLAVLDNSPYYNIKHVERLNGENTLTFSIAADHADSQFVAEGNTVAFRDIDLEWQMFEIRSVTDLHSDTLERTAHCEHISYELFDEIIRDIRPTNVSAAFALSQALTGTRWTAGTVSDFGLNSTNFFYESALSAVHKIAAIWGCDYRFRVAVTGGGISGRFVDLIQRGSVTGKQLSYGRHLESIERTVDTSMLVTALFGRGKGVQVETGGYGRRLTFADVVWHTPVTKPSGQEWVGDPTALSLFGRQGRHRFGIFLDNEETEADVLLQKTWDELQRRKNPRLTYSVRCADLEVLLGYAHDRMRLGDTINIVDREFVPDLLVSARVISLTRDLLNPENTDIMLGNYSEDLTTQTQAQNEINQTVSDRQGVWDRATAFDPATGRLPTTWLDGIINTLTNEVRAGTGTVTLTEGNGILIVDNPINPTRALRLLGGILAIANSRHPVTGEWNWRTFGTGDGFTADQINTGEIRTSLVRITGNSNFYWSGDALMIINPVRANEQIRLSRDGIHFTTNGGELWNVAIDFTGIRVEGTSGDGFTHYASDGVRVYDQAGALRTHLGRHESLSSPIAVYTRNSTAFLQNGTLVNTNTARYEVTRKAGARWRDVFDVDQISTHYTSGGDVPATWTVSNGVLSATGGGQATLLRTGLTIADGEIIANLDQAHDGGLIARHVDNNNYYLLGLHDDSGIHPTANLRIWRRVAGAFALLGDANITWTRGTAAQIRFRFNGSLLEAWFNNTRVITVTDTTFTSGGVGMRNSHAEATRFLDFAVHETTQALNIEEGTSNLLTLQQASVENEIAAHGITWRAGALPANRVWTSICWSPERGIFVAIAHGIDGVATSPDGEFWTMRTQPFNFSWASICWSPERGIFVAIAPGVNAIITSPDGVTWTQRTQTLNHIWTAICWSPLRGIFVVVSRTISGNAVLTSPDAITWTSHALGGSWSNVCWSPERQIFLASGGTGGTAMSVIIASANGISWSTNLSTSERMFFALTWAPGLGMFVAINFDGRVHASVDGVNGWDTVHFNLPNQNWTSVCWSQERSLLVAVSSTGDNRVATATAVNSWTLRSTLTANFAWNSVCWSPARDKFVAVANNSDRTMVSPDIILGWQATITRDTVNPWIGSASARATSTVIGNMVGYTQDIVIAPSTTYSISAYTRSAIIRSGMLVVTWLNAVGTTISNNIQNISLTPNWQRSTLTATSPATAIYARIEVQGFNTVPGDIMWFDGLQLEQKPFATSWQLPGTSRSGEVLTIPTAGIFNRGSWTIEGTYTPQIPMNVGGANKALFDMRIDATNWYIFMVASNGAWHLGIETNGVVRNITSAANAVLQGAYHWQISGNGTTLRLCVNGVLIGETTYTEPVGTIPANMFIGSIGGTSSWANGFIDDLRISRRARTLAEHQAVFNSGEKTPVDDDTNLLLLMDGSLLPTVRLFGLKIELAPGQIPLAIYRGAHQSLEIWQWQDNGAWIFYNSLTSDRTGVIGTDSRGFFLEGVNTAGTRVPVTIAGSLVTVQGNFTVTGTKAAMQQTETFGEQPLYARESPDIRYVIDGKAKIIDSECVIPIDPMFCECVEPDTQETPWLIHLTPWDDIRLKIEAITETQITVTGNADGIFCWTLSCIRRGYRNKWFDKICEEDNKCQ